MENSPIPNHYVQSLPNALQPMNMTKKQIVHQKFSPQEDEYLKQVVERIGTSDWAQVARAFNNSRTPRQCRERYKNYLAPGVVNGPWTEEEDQLLYQKYKSMGPQWVKIAKFFNGRTDINVKNRWVTKFKKVESGVFNQNIQMDQVPQISLQSQIPTGSNFELKQIPNLSEIPPPLPPLSNTGLISAAPDSTLPTNPLLQSDQTIDSASDLIKDVNISSDINLSQHLDDQK